MGRHNYTKTILMLLCFGMAFLSLAIHWYSQRSMQGMMSPTTQETNYKSEQTSARSQTDSKSPANSQQNQSWWPPFLRVEQASHATSQQAVNQPVKTLSKPVKIETSPNHLATNSSNSQLPSTANNSNPTQHKETKVIVDLSDRRVYVRREGKVIASYPTGIGKRGWDTPVGSFQIMHMEHDPIWKHPITGKIYPAGRSDSPLGARWIGFYSTSDGEIGFHGTPDEELVGTPVSHGCLRMRNEDVKMLYAQVNLGTPVTVRQ